MTRPTSWYPLASTDPVPGDAPALTQEAAEFRQVATTISTTKRSLDDLGKDSGMRSLALGELRDRTKELSEQIGQTQARYDSIADALTTYASALQRAQEAADDLLARARSAQHAFDEASQQRLRADAALRHLESDVASDPKDVDTQRQRLERARTDTDTAEGQLAALRAELELVVRERDAAARRAINDIDTAIATDDLNDTWWEDGGREIVTRISEVAGRVSTIAGTASLLLGWVPILGPALAFTATAAGIASLLSNLLLAAKGEKGWTDVAFDAAGMFSFGWVLKLSKPLRNLADEVPDVMRTVRTATDRSEARQFTDSKLIAGASTLTRLPSGDLKVRDLVSAGWREAPAAYATAFRNSFAQVMHGPNSLLTMAGNGELLADRQLLGRVQELAPFQRAQEVLNPALEKAAKLEQQVVWIHRIDVATNAYGGGQLVNEVMSSPTPVESARERLNL